MNTAHMGIEVIKYRVCGFSYFLKRTLDYLMVMPVMVILLPIMAVIAVAIKMDSKGPVIFKQKRLGLNGRPFMFYKFRSMVEQADSSVHEDYMKGLINGEKSKKKYTKPVTFKLTKDDRVTKVGRILRRTSLDELPQLLNVLKGNMSLVGPRPPIQYEVDIYEDWHKRRLDVIPGITGLWQVSGRSQLDFDDMVKLDLKYIDDWSLGLDLKILFRTVAVVAKRKGAW